MKIIPLIMAGGAGTRLWPLSNEAKPKQFHDFTGNGTLFENTVKRLKELNPEEFCVVTSGKYKNITENALKSEGVRGVVLSEPEPKNTAAAILFGARYIKEKYGDAIVIVLPADHHIEDTEEYLKIVEKAVQAAEHECLVTLGIKPHYAETGYGYIEAAGKTLNEVHDVVSFKEKPDLHTAQKYLQSENFYWNSGIYIWKNSTVLNSFEKIMPQHFSIFKKLETFDSEAFHSPSEHDQQIIENIFSQLDTVSIDHGILEKEDNIKIIPGEFGWADLGSWKSVDAALPKDENRNSASTASLASFYESLDCTVFPGQKKIYVAGCDNITVIEGPEEILVLHKNMSQHIKEIKGE